MISGSARGVTAPRGRNQANRGAAMQTGKRKLQAGLQQWMQALPFLLAGFVLMALFVLYPLVRNIWISFTDFNVIQNRPNAWVGLRNYLSLLSDQNYRIAFRNTILYALVTVQFFY